MFGTSRLGLTASPAKSVTANRTNPAIASVHRIVRMGRAVDGGAGRGAQAPLGRPHLGQKFPANKVPHRGHGQPTGLSGAADGRAVMEAGGPQRGRNWSTHVSL